MTLKPNAWQETMIFILTGEQFPRTDEDEANIRNLDYLATKGNVEILKGRIRDAVKYVGDALPGDVGASFIDSMNEVLPYLDKLTDGMTEVAGGLRKTAMDVREAKWQLIAELIRLAVEIAVLTALSYFTGGTSLSAIAVRKLVAKARMLVILLELSTRLHFLPSITEAIEEAFQTLVVRLALMKWGPDGQRPDGIDWKDVGISAFVGGLAGAFASIFSNIAKDITGFIDKVFDNTLKDPPNKWGRNFGPDDINGPGRHRGGGNDVPNGNHHDFPDGNRGGGPDGVDGVDGPKGGGGHGDGKGHHDDGHEFDLKDQPLQFVADGGAEWLAEAITMGAFYGDFGASWMTFVGAGLSERVEAGLEAGIGKGFGSLHDLTFKAPSPNGSRDTNARDWGDKRSGGTGGRSGHGDTTGGRGEGGGDGGDRGADGTGAVNGGPPSLDLTSGPTNFGTGLDTGGFDGGSEGYVEGGTANFTESVGSFPSNAGSFTGGVGSFTAGAGRFESNAGKFTTETGGSAANLGSHNGSSGGSHTRGSGAVDADVPAQAPRGDATSGRPVTSSSTVPDAPGRSGQSQGQGEERGPGNRPPTAGSDAPRIPVSSTGSTQGLHGDSGTGNGHRTQHGDVDSARGDTEVEERSLDGGSETHTQHVDTQTDRNQDQSGNQNRDLTQTRDPDQPKTQTQPRTPDQNQSRDQVETPEPESSTGPPSASPPVSSAVRPPSPVTTSSGAGHATDVPGQRAPNPSGTTPDGNTRGGSRLPEGDGHDDFMGGEHVDTPSDADIALALDQHAQAVRAFTDAVHSMAGLRNGTGTDSATDAALHQAMADAGRAWDDVVRIEGHLRDLGVDPYGPVPDSQPDSGPVIVPHDGVERAWLAQQVSAQDLPAGTPDFEVDGTVGLDSLRAAGITVPPGMLAQEQLGVDQFPLQGMELSTVEQARLLMLGPGPWPQSLDVIAANVTRRLWGEAYTDFVDSTAGETNGGPAVDPSRAWNTATALVLPVDAHPVLADFRYAGAPYRDAVRQVADLLMTGGDPRAATDLADRLRSGLGLPARNRGGERTPTHPSPLTESAPPLVTTSSEPPPAADTSSEAPPIPVVTSSETPPAADTSSDAPRVPVLTSSGTPPVTGLPTTAPPTTAPPTGTSPTTAPFTPKPVGPKARSSARGARGVEPVESGAPPAGRFRSAVPPRTHSFATPLSTVPEDAPLTVPPPAPPAPPAPPPAAPPPRGVRPPTWVGQDIDRRRPPRIDRDLPPAPLDGGGPVRFTDGSRLPAYMGGIAALHPGLSPEVVRRSYTFGQSDPVLRGTDQVAAEVVGRLPGRVAAASPKKRWGTAGRPLLEDVQLRLARNPRGFFGDGQRFTYRTTGGRTRVVTVTARPYGNWSRFTFGYANPVKVDTMQRTTTTTGRTAVNSTSTSLVPLVPLGPAKEQFHVWGRVHFRKSWGKRAQYAMQNQTLNQIETRTTDGSHPHLGDVWYDVRVTDRLGRPVDEAGNAVRDGSTRAVGFGFAVRDGVAARLADSLTHDKPLPESLPDRMDLGGRPSYRLVNTEAYGPVAHIRDWTLHQAGVKSDSVAGAQLSDFFSTDGFHRMSRVLNAGRTTTPPLFRDSAGQSPLGVFSVEVRSGDAVRISETKAAELRDITQSTIRNERVVGRSKNTEIGGSVGPSFQFFGLERGAFDLRLLFGINARYGSSRGRTSTTGGTGAVKAAGQAKGDPTGLYIVQKTITVTAPPDTKAPLPDRRGDGGARRGKLRKNPPGTWSLPPRSQTFQTWAVERLTRTEARRLAGLDGGPPHGAGPAVPPYLAEDDPTTLGMARPEEFTFADGAFTRTTGGRERTFPEHLAEHVLDQVARAYPDLVAPLAELNSDNPRWRDADHFQIVLSNSLEVLSTLTHHGMAGNLETMMTSGLRVALVDSGRITRGLRYVWIDARLTGRRYEGAQKDLRLRFSAPGSENLGGQQSGGRGLHIGAEGLLSVRDSGTDNIGVPLHAGTASLGGRYGTRHDSDSSHGPSVTHEAMSIGTKGSHLYSYQLTVTARRGGFWRFRSLLRGILFLNLLGTQPFVFSERESNLFGPAPHSRPPVVGRVLLSIPAEHVPTARTTPRDPHPLHGTPLRMPTRLARDLALATPALFEQAARRRPPKHQRHPFLTLAVTSHPGLAQAAQETLEEASDASWLLSQEGAPSHDAALRAFQSQYLTANFDQTSGPLAWRVSGLWDKAPYLNRSSVLAHRTTIVPGTLTALTGPVPVHAEITIGGITPVAGRNARVSTLFFGGQLGYLHSHHTGPGVTGTYGVAVSPYRLDRSRVLTVSRSAVAEINRKDFNRQVLVSGDVQHEIAAASSTVGQKALGRRWVPRRLAGAAGRRVRVDDGWTGHIPEKSAYRLGLLTDRWSGDRHGGVPLYTGRSWSPQPWLLDNPFGGFPVNSLNAASVLLDFDRKLRPLGWSKADRDAVLRLMSDRVVRALGKEMVGAGSSVTAGIGRWGSRSVQFWVGGRQARARAELIPVRVPRTPADADGDGPGFAGLGHSVELEEHRQAVETVQEGRDRASGASVGTVVTEGVHTGNDTVRAAGPTYSEVGSTQQNVGQNRSEGSVRIATATTTQAHGEYVTRYRLRLSLEVTDTGDAHGTPDAGPAATTGGFTKRAGRWARKVTGRRRLSVVSEGDVGDLVEHYPLSLMRPDPLAPAEDGAPGPDPLAPPALAPPGAPHKVDLPHAMGPGGWHDVPHPGDGDTKPFTLPEDGFKVRRIIGLDQLHDANALALAAAYDPSLQVPRTGPPGEQLLAKALDTPLTRAGTGSAQNLEDGTGNGALTAFYDRTLTPHGYQVPGLTDRGFFGGADGDLTLYSKPDFGGAQLLAVTDGMKHEAPKRDTHAGGMSATRVGTTESSLGGGPVTSTQNTGSNQMGASGPGDSSTDSDAFTASGDRLASVNVKPNTTRSFLFAIPTTWLSVAAVRHHVKDSGAVRLLRGPFGDTTRVPQAVQTDTAVLAWVREDIARDLGLIDDTRFPPKVAKAWDAVTKADKAWTAADKKYWDLRRGEGQRLEAALEQAERNLAALTARDPETLPQIVAAREALRRVQDETESAEPAHDGWAELQDEQLERAGQRLADLRRAAADEVAAARRTRDEARDQLDTFTDLLQRARTTAEALADTYAQTREDADRLTRYHQLHSTEEGRRHLGTTPEPDAVTFTPPPAAAESKPPEPKKDESKKDEPKKSEPRKDDGTKGGSEDRGADRSGRPAYARPPWQPDPEGPGVRFDAASDHRTLTATEPDGRARVYDLHRPEADGNGFFAAVAHALGGRPTPLAELAARVARSRYLPDDPALDPDAVFHPRELDIRIGRGFSRDAALRAGVQANGGRLTDAVRDGLTPFQRRSLVRLHVQRARRWDDATADLAASLTARTLGVNLTVVQEDGSARRYSGAGPRATGPLGEATVYRRGDSYLSALPRPIGSATAATDHTTTTTSPPPARPAPPAPTPPPPRRVVTETESTPVTTTLTTPVTTVDRGLGLDPAALDVPVVDLDEAHRRWIARQLTDGDLPADRSGLGIPDPEGIYDADDPVDQVRELMTGTGHWPQPIRAVAAHATLRLWNETYARFADAALDADPEAGRGEVRRNWYRALGLITRAERESALADPRLAGDRIRDAVRQVAELLVAGGSRSEARALADRLRGDLGLRPPKRLDTPDAPRTAPTPPPAPTSPVPTSPAPVPEPVPKPPAPAPAPVLKSSVPAPPPTPKPPAPAPAPVSESPAPAPEHVPASPAPVPASVSDSSVPAPAPVLKSSVPAPPPTPKPPVPAPAPVSESSSPAPEHVPASPAPVPASVSASPAPAPGAGPASSAPASASVLTSAASPALAPDVGSRVLASSTPAADVRTSGEKRSPHPAAALSVAAAVPVRARPRPHIDFAERDKSLDADALRQIGELAKEIVSQGLRELSAGLSVPEITVTGYGNGPRFTIGSSAVRQAEHTGQRRAQAVADALRTAIRRELAASEPASEAVWDRLGRAVGVDDFPIAVRSGGRTAPVSGMTDAVGGPVERRRVVIDVERSPLTPVLDRLQQLYPRLDFFESTVSSLSLDDVADLALSSPAGTAARSGPEKLRDLYDLVADAMTAGRDSSPAALATFHLSRQGLFEDDTLLTENGTPRGRDWTYEAGKEVDTATYHVVPLTGRNSVTSPGPWARAGAPAPYVVAAHGDHETVSLRLPDGRRWRTSREVFAELLTMDPVLAGQDRDVPVVLVSPRAADMGLDLPRLASFRTRRTVWAHSGRVRLSEDPQTSRRRIDVEDERAILHPLGTWIASEPDDWAQDDRSDVSAELPLTDGTTVHADEIKSVTLPLDGRSTGRMLMDTRDHWAREPHISAAMTSTEWYAIDPTTNEPVGGPRPVPWKGRKPYFLWVHGNPGRTRVVGAGTRPRTMPGSSTGRYVRRRPSLRRLAPDVPIVLVSCWGDSLASEELPDADGPTPFVSDPLAVTSVAQDIANDNQRTVFAPNRIHLTQPHGGGTRHGVYTSALGTQADWREVRPEPDAAGLDAVARTAGIDDPAIGAEERRDAALRLVRAMRRIFGVSVEDDRSDYRELLGGLGALEVMRRQNTQPVGGVFTLDLLERATWAHTGQPPKAGSPVPPSPRPADVRATLRAARAALDADGRMGLSGFVSLPAVDRAREVLRTAGGLEGRARRALGIPAGKKLTPADGRALMWAVVKAVEAVDNHPDADALTRRVLHLSAGQDPRDPAHRDALLWTAIGAAAIGRDVHNPVALAAFDLQQHGALDDGSIVSSTGGDAVGRNWSPRAVTGRLETKRYTVVDPTGGRASSEHPTPWAAEGPDRGDPYVVVLSPGAEPDTVAMAWPDGTTRSVPYAEIAELVRHDRVMRQMPFASEVRVVPVGLGPDTGKLVGVFTDRRSANRPVIATPRPLELRHDATNNTTSLELTVPPPYSDRNWTLHRPRPLPGPAPVTVPAPAPAPAPVTAQAPVTPSNGTTAGPRTLTSAPADQGSPAGSLGSADMDLDTPEAVESPAPATPSPDALYHQALVRIFGGGITRNRLYPQLHDAVTRLDRLRRSAQDPALHEGPLDLDAVAREVLLLDPGTPVTDEHHGDLFRIALDPAVAQARGLATLTAFGLALRGSQSPATALTGSDGTPYGRNWIDPPGTGERLDLNLDATAVLVEHDDGTFEEADPRPAPWRPAPGRPRPFVVLAGGNSEVVTVALRDGSEVTVGPDVFIELLAMDPVLAGLPKDVPVVLVVPRGGAGALELPRALADRLGREVWSTSGTPALNTKDDGTPATLTLEKKPGVPRGEWIRSSPGEVVPEDRTDVPEWERRMVSFTLVADEDGHPQLGRALFRPAELAGTREHLYRNLHKITSYRQVHPGTFASTPDLPLNAGARPGERVYHLILHGLPDSVSVPQEDGRTYRASGESFTGWLKRRPSVRRLRDQDWIYLEACWAGRSADGGDANTAGNVAVSLPPTADPLADLPVAQIVANGTRKRVRAVDRATGHQESPGPNPGFWKGVYTDAQGRYGRILEFWPEPLDAELADRARTAGLHTGAGPVPREILDRTLRLVRALRLALGPGIDGDLSYDDLLRGIGALEAMGLRDPELAGTGPFTMDLFQRAALADRRDHGGGTGPVDAAAYRGLLTRAAAAPQGTALTDFVRVPHLVGIAQQTRSFKNPAATAARVLRLDPSATVGERETSRLFWAQVRSFEWLSGVTDVGATAATVLHLNAPDPAKRAELGWLATRAIAAGRNPHNLVELAAFHLEELGAFAAQTGMRDAAGRPSGRNWAQPLPTGAHLDASVLGTVTPGPGGGLRRTGEDPSPWLAQGKDPAYVVSVGGAGSGRTWLNLPGGRFAVPDAEVAELIARDPGLVGRDLLTTDIVLAGVPAGAAVPLPGAPLPLRHEVSWVTARPVWTSTGMAGPGRAGNTGPFSVGGSSAADWAVTRPGDAWQARQLARFSPPAGRPPIVITADTPGAGFTPLNAAAPPPPPEAAAGPDTDTSSDDWSDRDDDVFDTDLSDADLSDTELSDADPSDGDPDELSVRDGATSDSGPDEPSRTDPHPAPVVRATSSTVPGATPAGDAPASPQAPSPDPARTLAVTAAVPVRGGDWLPGALAGALRTRAPGRLGRPGLGAVLSGPDPADGLHRWVETRLAAPDAAHHVPGLAADGWAGAGPTLTVDELKDVGVELTGDQLGYATLAGGLTAQEVTLSLAQRYRLLRRRGDAAAVTEIAAALAAAELGIRITLTEPDGSVRHFDPYPAGEPLLHRP